MYEKPTLERFGTFRELTLGGGTYQTDIFTVLDNNSATPDGCIGPPTKGTINCLVS